MSVKIVKDIMHKGVIACHPNTAVTEVVRVLADTEVHAIVVTGPDGELTGIISHMDVIPLFGQPLEGKTAGEIMKTDLITVGQDTPIDEAIGLMTARGIKRLPVVGPDGTFLGMISRDSLLRAAITGGQESGYASIG